MVPGDRGADDGPGQCEEASYITQVPWRKFSMGWADSWQWSSRPLGMLQMLSWAAAVSWLVPNEGRARGPARFQGLDTEWLGEAFCNVLHLQDPMSRLEAP